MTNPPPVAPVVTDEMVQAALKIACNQRPVGCGDGDTYTVSVPTFFSMRAAITAALEASGELERLRAALKAAEDKQCASCRHCDSFGLSAALQKDAQDEIQEICDLVDQSQPSQTELSQGRVISRFKW